MFQRFVFWPLFACVMGFVVGGSFVWSLNGAQPTIDHISSASEHQASTHEAKSKKEESDEALAYYTLWLMAFTGVLAVATIGLGVATFGLYLTGEKQIKVVMRGGVRQDRNTRASIAVAESANKLNRDIFTATQRPWLRLSVKLVGPFDTDFKTASVRLQIVLTNVGDKPAFGIFCISMTYPNGEGGHEIEYYRRLSASLRSGPRAAGFGDTLFPGESLQVRGPRSEPLWFQDNIDAARNKGFMDTPLGVCICADYFSAIDESHHYQIGSIQVLMKRDGTDGWTSFTLADGPVAQQDLILYQHPLGSQVI